MFRGCVVKKGGGDRIALGKRQATQIGPIRLADYLQTPTFSPSLVKFPFSARILPIVSRFFPLLFLRNRHLGSGFAGPAHLTALTHSAISVHQQVHVNHKCQFFIPYHVCITSGDALRIDTANPYLCDPFCHVSVQRAVQLKLFCGITACSIGYNRLK